jgi:hypothetical protein
MNWKHTGFSIESKTRLFSKADREAFKSYEFVDQLAAHLPPRRVQLVRRYGVYAGKVRKQWQERPGIYRLAPESRQKGHPNKAISVAVKPQESEDAVQAPDAWFKLRKQSRARLLEKVYEVDPFVCPKCRGLMSVAAIIEEPKELTKIIDWASQQKKGEPVTVCARASPELALTSV